MLRALRSLARALVLVGGINDNIFSVISQSDAGATARSMHIASRENCPDLWSLLMGRDLVSLELAVLTTLIG